MRSPYATMLHTYVVTTTLARGGTYIRGSVPRSHAAELMRQSRAWVAEGLATSCTVEHAATRVEYDTFATAHNGGDYVHMCYACEARPTLWEMDCDGPYDTSECGQCDWWAIVNARDALETPLP